MKSTKTTQSDGASVQAGDAKTFEFEGWTLHEFEVVNSTNLVASTMPDWHAVRAVTQTAGRGRFQRAWVSDAGGLWLSAVVPMTAEYQRLLPLAVGCAVCRTLKQLGIQQLRMRWPNDILIDNRKLAGLLIDQFRPDSAVVGLGINGANQPYLQDETLLRQCARLVDFLPAALCDLHQLTRLLLRALRLMLPELSTRGVNPLVDEINGLWGAPRSIQLDLDGSTVRGLFRGVDDEGNLILEAPGTGPIIFSANQVRHLTENL